MNRIRLVPLLATVALALAACTSMPDSASTRLPDLRVAAVSSATVDFEANLVGGDYLLDDGEIDASKQQVGVDSGVATGLTFSAGDPVEGPIHVRGERNPAAWEANFARIFDSTCGGGTADDCTGDDGDLFAPLQGNVLIVQEGDTAGEPDDAVGERFTIDFSDFGPTGSVDVHEFFYIDVEVLEGVDDLPTVQFLDGDGGVLYDIATTGGGVSETWPTDEAVETPIMGVHAMVVTFSGSGAIDDIVIDVPQEEEPSEGCTPGYWRNHAGMGPGPQPNMWPDTYDPATAYFESAFGVDDVTIRAPRSGTIDDPLLFEASKAIGGGVNALARHAVAALLNAASPDVSYAYTVDEVITAVQEAFDTGSYGYAQNMFVVANEAGCPL